MSEWNKSIPSGVTSSVSFSTTLRSTTKTTLALAGSLGSLVLAAWIVAAGRFLPSSVMSSGLPSAAAALQRGNSTTGRH